MDELNKLHHLFLLKEVERTACGVNGRAESVAEHTYSSLMLALYFLPKIEQKLDELKVLKMILFHDVVEIEAGDTYTYDEKANIGKPERESKAAEVFAEKLPEHLANDWLLLWNEFEEKKTPEARFCNAIDKFDPIMHSLMHSLHKSENWKEGKIMEELLRKKKEHLFAEFPVLHEAFETFIDHAKKNNYFSTEATNQ